MDKYKVIELLSKGEIIIEFGLETPHYFLLDIISEAFPETKDNYCVDRYYFRSEKNVKSWWSCNHGIDNPKKLPIINTNDIYLLMESKINNMDKKV